MAPIERIEAIGRALYGDVWITKLAQDIEYAPSTVLRWTTGATRPSRRAVKDVQRLARRKKVGIAAK
jgi:DNA-binding transcriptional regulator YdaS (Cro superfamily)